MGLTSAPTDVSTSDAPAPAHAPGRTRRRIIARSTIHLRRLVISLAMATGALIVGGGLGVLVAIMMVMVALDAMVPMPGRTLPEADDRFRLAAARRRRAIAMRRFRGRSACTLDVLDDQTGWASTAARRSLGVTAIPINSVTGTVEELKARTFDCAFRPGASTAEHWKRLWMAQSNGAVLPPISVYRVRGTYIVRDGHHRVSVARDQGFTEIDAEVTELLT
jgi:hypothetical protein